MSLSIPPYPGATSTAFERNEFSRKEAPRHGPYSPPQSPRLRGPAPAANPTTPATYNNRFYGTTAEQR